jgi:hypothetical protein
MTQPTHTEPETVVIGGITYTVDRSDYEVMSTMISLCTLVGPRGATANVVRDTIRHGAYLAAGIKALERTSTRDLRTALEPLFPLTPDDHPDWCTVCAARRIDPTKPECKRRPQD